jgi:hypothetical protein
MVVMTVMLVFLKFAAMGALQAVDPCYPSACRVSVKPFVVRLKLFAAAGKFGPKNGSGIGAAVAQQAA